MGPVGTKFKTPLWIMQDNCRVTTKKSAMHETIEEKTTHFVSYDAFY